MSEGITPYQSKMVFELLREVQYSDAEVAEIAAAPISYVLNERAKQSLNVPKRR